MLISRKVIVLGVVALLVVGFLVGRVVTIPTVDEFVGETKEKFEEYSDVPSQEKALEQENIQSEKEESINPISVEGAVDVAKQLDITALTPAQKSMLDSFGVDTTAITVTTAMIACAREKIGEVRLEEIMKGDTPTFLEGASLFACYSR